MPGKPADHWLPPEVYDPGEWGVDDVYLFIISDGSISRKPRLKPPPKREPPPEEPAPCRTCGQSPAELAAAHAALVAALQAEFYADDLALTRYQLLPLSTNLSAPVHIHPSPSAPCLRHAACPSRS